MDTATHTTFSSVYGPVHSWRFGRSLGIDPIGHTSTCSFNCVYCQLGEIQTHTVQRRIFIPTAEIREDLLRFAPWDVDVITVSGSGEPTLAGNLGDILTLTKRLTNRPVGVLTNGTLLTESAVRHQLAHADFVSVKLDAISSEQIQRVNRPVQSFNLVQLWAGIQQFRQEYSGHLAIQTMLLSAWSEAEQSAYIRLIQAIAPDEVQLNIATRPRPLQRVLDARGNQLPDPSQQMLQWLRPISSEIVHTLGDRIQAETGISVRWPKHLGNSRPASF
jgi:wyosine [tRNA(Phe)-imidazoG37] synthetase (radical SAM superfamily)